VPTEQTPVEAIETAYEAIRSGLVGEILEQIMGCSPDFFKRLVVDLLLRMGYRAPGRTRAEPSARAEMRA
jgi:restriction system protein